MQELMTKAPVSKADDFIFANNNGEMRSYHGTRTMFMRLLKKHGLEDAGIHFISCDIPFPIRFLKRRKIRKLSKRSWGIKR